MFWLCFANGSSPDCEIQWSALSNAIRLIADGPLALVVFRFRQPITCRILNCNLPFGLAASRTVAAVNITPGLKAIVSKRVTRRISCLLPSIALSVPVGGRARPDAGDPSRWTAADVRERFRDRLGVRCAIEGVRRLMRRPGFRHLSPGPVHPETKPEFRRNLARLTQEAVPDGLSPVHFQDESHIGQQGILPRVRARKGAHPRIVKDHRYG